MSSQANKERVQRISISLKESLFRSLDQLIAERGFSNRSQAIAEMINQSLSEHYEKKGSQIMAGTITIFYDSSKAGILEKLASIERKHIQEVISSQHVLLEKERTMEVLLVQGPASKLNQIADKLISCKGVHSGQLVLTSFIMPPLHRK